MFVMLFTSTSLFNHEFIDTCDACIAYVTDSSLVL